MEPDDGLEGMIPVDVVETDNDPTTEWPDDHEDDESGEADDDE